MKTQMQLQCVRNANTASFCYLQFWLFADQKTGETENNKEISQYLNLTKSDSFYLSA